MTHLVTPPGRCGSPPHSAALPHRRRLRLVQHTDSVVGMLLQRCMVKAHVLAPSPSAGPNTSAHSARTQFARAACRCLISCICIGVCTLVRTCSQVAQTAAAVQTSGGGGADSGSSADSSSADGRRRWCRRRQQRRHQQQQRSQRAPVVQTVAVAAELQIRTPREQATAIGHASMPVCTHTQPLTLANRV